MKSQVITGHYSGKDHSIVLWYRNENDVKDRVKIVGFQPHFFIPVGTSLPHDDRFREMIKTDIPGLFGTNLVRLNVSDPASVSGARGGKGLRDYFEKHWEADVRYIDRFLINSGICNGFEFSGKKVVHFRDLHPIDFTLPPLVAFWDIEVLTKTRFPNPNLPHQPLISSSVWDSKYQKYFTFIYDPPNKSRKEVIGNWIKVYCESEKEVLTLTNDYFQRVKPDVISGWNIQFDVGYFQARCRHLKIKTDFRYACIFDLCGGYKFLCKRLGNRLKEVVIEEGVAEEVVSEEFHAEFWEDPKQRPLLMLYNKKDVEYCVEINKKRDIIPFYWDLKNFVGKEDMTHMTHGLLIDQFLLRKAHGRWILPSRPPKGKRGKSFKAAVVFEPAEGVFGAESEWTGSVDPSELGVAVMDMSRFYPNIMKAYYSQRLRFSKDPNENLFPEIIDDLMAKREEYESIMKQHPPTSREYQEAKRKRNVVKSPLLSGVWGYIGWAGSRIFDRDKAAFIAGKAREGLEIVQKRVKELGYPVIYGDTDSAMSEVKLEEVPYVVDKINEVFMEYCTKENIPPLLQIKMDKFYRRALWVEVEGKERGAKKKYMGHCVREGDKVVDYIDAKGFELIRGNASKVTRRLQGDVGDAILRKGTNGLIERIQQLIKDMRGGEFSLDDIAITIHLHKKLDSSNVDYYRGARYSNKWLGADIRPGDMIRMVYVKRIKGKPLTDVISYLDQEKLPEVTVDWSKMINRTVEKKVKRLLRLVDIQWGHVEGYNPLESYFG